MINCVQEKISIEHWVWDTKGSSSHKIGAKEFEKLLLCRTRNSQHLSSSCSSDNEDSGEDLRGFAVYDDEALQKRSSFPNKRVSRDASPSNQKGREGGLFQVNHDSCEVVTASAAATAAAGRQGSSVQPDILALVGEGHVAMQRLSHGGIGGISAKSEKRLLIDPPSPSLTLHQTLISHHTFLAPDVPLLLPGSPGGEEGGTRQTPGWEELPPGWSHTPLLLGASRVSKESASVGSVGSGGVGGSVSEEIQQAPQIPIEDAGLPGRVPASVSFSQNEHAGATERANRPHEVAFHAHPTLPPHIAAAKRCQKMCHFDFLLPLEPRPLRSEWCVSVFEWCVFIIPCCAV